jgi:hypothetical protein
MVRFSSCTTVHHASCCSVPPSGSKDTCQDVLTGRIYIISYYLHTFALTKVIIKTDASTFRFYKMTKLSQRLASRATLILLSLEPPPYYSADYWPQDGDVRSSRRENTCKYYANPRTNDRADSTTQSRPQSCDDPASYISPLKRVRQKGRFR